MQYAPPPNLCILRDARMITQASVANTALLSCIIHAKAKFRKQAVEREINEEKDLMKMQMQFEFLNQMHSKIRFSSKKAKFTIPDPFSVTVSENPKKVSLYNFAECLKISQKVAFEFYNFGIFHLFLFN